MLSFEVSFIDVVLMLAVMVLLIFQITKQSKKSVVEQELSEPKLSVFREKVVDKPLEAVETQKPVEEASEPQLSVFEEKVVDKPWEAVETQKPVEEAQVQTIPQTSSVEGCPKYFGYLKKLPKDAPIPDQCFRCPRMTDCFCK